MVRTRVGTPPSACEEVGSATQRAWRSTAGRTTASPSTREASFPDGWILCHFKLSHYHHNCLHIRPRHTGLDEISAEPELVATGLRTDFQPLYLKCSNPGCGQFFRVGDIDQFARRVTRWLSRTVRIARSNVGCWMQGSWDNHGDTRPAHTLRDLKLRCRNPTSFGLENKKCFDDIGSVRTCLRSLE